MKALTTFFLVLLLTALEVSSQQKTQLLNWSFLKSDLGSAWEGVRYAAPGSQEAVPFWTDVTVPHSYNAFDAVHPTTNYYQGPAWYKTFLSPVDDTTQCVLLHFEGAGQRASVYLFDRLVAEHVGGYDEWSVDITNDLRKLLDHPYLAKHYNGQIPLLVRTDNSRDVELIPSDLSDFNIYGGLYRPVTLIQVSKVYASDVLLDVESLVAEKRGNIKSEIKVNTVNDAIYRLTVTVLAPDGKAVFSSQMERNNATVKLDIPVEQPLLWSPDQPHLYTFMVTVESAYGKYSTQRQIGFRSFDFKKHGPFLLNGQRLLLQGTHRHEDHAGLGPVQPYELLKKEMLLMKAMGVNFIRLGHYQQQQTVLNLCDSLGILVWEEIPWCRGGLGGHVYRQQARSMLTNMIHQHQHHPSVIIWGLGNENDWPGDFDYFEKDSIRAFMSELNELAHQTDAGRKTGIRRCDFCSDIVDVYSPSIWAGWYRGNFTEYKQASEEWRDKVDHFFHMEWGASHHGLRHAEQTEKALAKIKTGQGTDERAGDASLTGGVARVSKDGDWTVSYACDLIDWHLKEQTTMPWLTGTAYWPFKDFSTPVRPDNPIPYVNQKGVLERDLTPKESYYVFQSYWAEAPMVHVYGSTWPVRWGAAGEMKTVKVYSNCDEVELFLNGKSMGKKQRNTMNYPAAGLRWELAFKKGENVLLAKGMMNGELVEHTIHQQYETRQWGTPHHLIWKKHIRESGIREYEFCLVDDKGVVCLDSKAWITFDYVGDGKLLADLGTSKGSRKIQLANGRAFIRVETANGVLSAKVEGIERVFISIKK